MATLRMAVILMIAAEAMSFTLGISRIGAQPTPVALLEAGHAVLIIAAIYFAWGFLTQLIQEPESPSETKN